MDRKICKFLEEIEREKNLKILFAVESGSRAWQLGSKDSDFDVRFVYRRPLEDYLHLNRKPDVIEKTVKEQKLDFVGFDIYKFCGLLNSSNPSVIEWLKSDMVYSGQKPPELVWIAEKYFNPIALYQHYKSMGKQNYLSYLKSGKQVSYKKYLYAMRGLINAKYVEKFSKLPPMDFNRTLEEMKAYLPEYIYKKLKQLIETKKNAGEKGIIRNIVKIDNYIEDELKKEVRVPSSKNTRLLDEINKFLLKEVAKA